MQAIFLGPSVPTIDKFIVCLVIHSNDYCYYYFVAIYCCHLVVFPFVAGLDLHRPVVYEHSKRLLGNLIVLLACREDYTAACEARLTQYDMFMHSSIVSLSGQEEAELERYGSVCSIGKREGIVQTSLAQRVRGLIKFVSLRYSAMNDGCAHLLIYGFVCHI